MKIHTLKLLVILAFFSCEKENSDENLPDYRNVVTGEYQGIKYDYQLSWDGTSWNTVYGDTTETTLMVDILNDSDSLIRLSLSVDYAYAYLYRDGKFEIDPETGCYHCPSIQLTENGSLKAVWQPGLGPHFTVFETIKAD